MVLEARYGVRTADGAPVFEEKRGLRAAAHPTCWPDSPGGAVLAPGEY